MPHSYVLIKGSQHIREVGHDEAITAQLIHLATRLQRSVTLAEASARLEQLERDYNDNGLLYIGPYLDGLVYRQLTQES